MSTGFRLGVCLTAGLLMTPGVQALDIDDFSIHGFVSQGYAVSTENNWLPHSTDGSFEYNEIGLNVGMQLSDTVRVGAQFFSRDYGDLGNNQIELDWAYGDYSHADWLGVRVGRIKTPLGLYNEFLDLDLARTFALYPQSVYRANFRDVQVAYNGIGLYGMLDFGVGGSVDYDIYAGDVLLDPDQSVGKEFESAVFDVTDIDVKYNNGARVVWNTPLEGLRVAGSLYWLDDMTVDGMIADLGIANPLFSGVSGSGYYEMDRFYQYIFSAEYTWQDWVFSGEYSRSKGFIEFFIELPALPGLFPGGTVLGGTNDVDWEGFYLSVTHRLNEQWELGAYYSVFHPDADNTDGNPLLYDNVFTFAARYDVSDNWTLKGEVQIHDGVGQLPSRFQDPGHSWEEDWQLLLLKTTFSF